MLLKIYAFFLAAAICLGLGVAAFAQTTNLFPTTTTFSQGTSATMAAYPANPSRRGLTICGGTASNSLVVTFGTVTTPASNTGFPIAAQSCANFPPVALPPPAGGGYAAQVNLIAITGAVQTTIFEW